MKQEHRDSPILITVTDKEINWAAQHLGLNENAFHGINGNDPRSDVLKNMQTTDVAACPGSGKTTLLVAKLAILAENWPHRTRGICVLSHTNKAREVIEAKLGNTKAGRNLLSYPHYVGTIHGFINMFLTLPFLRSLGHNSVQFDTEISGKKIWKLSGYGKNIPRYVYTKFKQDEAPKKAIQYSYYLGDELDIQLTSHNHSVILRRKGTSDTFSVLNQWKCDVLREGYISYEDTFAYAHLALKEYPFLVDIIRNRFPFLFIDEAQDNSEGQSAILQRIFMDGDTSIIRQRFGDTNQAIYDSMYSKAAATDIFPDENAIDIPNSHRFCQRIANLANPLGLEPIPDGLIGHGPAKPKILGAKHATHTIFLFDKDSADKVMGAYAELIVDTFSEQELISDNFIATAIGQVHRPPDEEVEKKFPHHIGHYWPEYDCNLSKSNPKPQTFVQYILTGQVLAERKNETFPAVEKIAEAILRLASIGSEKINYQNKRYKHRFVKDALVSYPMSVRMYECLISNIAIDKSTLTKGNWDNYWHGIVLNIAAFIASANLTGNDVDEFMQWNTDEGDLGLEKDATIKKDNIYCYTNSNPKVKIHMGSIHSVKGDEHTATLVLETFWNMHNLEDIFKWFMNGNNAKDCSGVQRSVRMKLHFVAMSRPTHLLCLAMKRNSFENSKGEINPKLISKVEEMGWNIQYV